MAKNTTTDEETTAPEPQPLTPFEELQRRFEALERAVKAHGIEVRKPE